MEAYLELLNNFIYWLYYSWHMENQTIKKWRNPSFVGEDENNFTFSVSIMSY